MSANSLIVFKKKEEEEKKMKSWSAPQKPTDLVDAVREICLLSWGYFLVAYSGRRDDLMT